MRNTYTTIVFTILFLSFFKGLAFQKKDLSNADKEFIQNEKNTDSIASTLTKRINTDPELAEASFQIYLERGIKENNYRIKFSSYYFLSDIAYNKGDYITSIKYSNIASEIAEEENNDTLKLSSYTLNGNSFFAIRYYNNASIQYQKARENARNIDNKEMELSSQININNCWVRISRYEEALRSFEEVNKKLEYKEYRGYLYYNNFLSTQIGAGVCHYKLQNYDKAIVFYKKGLAAAKELHLSALIATFHNTLGEAYTAKNEYNLAIRHLDTAKTLSLKNDMVFNQNLFTTNYHIASLYFLKHDFKKSFEVLKESFDTIDSEGNEKQVEKIDEMYDLARKCSKELSNPKNELFFSNAYNRIINVRHQDDINTRDQLYNDDLLQLEEEKDVLKSKNSIYVISLVLIVCILLLFFIYHLQKQKRNRILFQTLQKAANSRDMVKKETVIKKQFVTDQKANDLFLKLKELEKTLFFLKEDCNLYTTAKLIDTNTTYLSKILNEYQKKSFNEYINSLRISYCLTQLKVNKKFRSYTIKAIASELGYKSVNTFASSFKKQTGISHSYYLKQILKKEIESV